MSTHLPGFQSHSVFLHHFVLAKLATNSIRVKLLKSNQSKVFKYYVTSCFTFSYGFMVLFEKDILVFCMIC